MNDFPKSSLTHVNIKELPQTSFPLRVTILPASNLLLILDLADTTGFWGRAYSLDSIQLLGKFLPKGDQNGEAINITQMQYNEAFNELYITDPAGKQILVFTPRKDRHAKVPLVYKSRLHQGLHDTARIALPRAVVFGKQKQVVDVNTNTKSRAPRFLCFFDSTLVIQKRTAELPVSDTSLPYYILNFVFDTGLSFSNDNNYFVSNGYNADLITLFDTSGNVVRQVHGPADTDPAYSIQQVSSNSLRVLPARGNHFSYTSRPRMNDHELFVLYNGKSINESDFHVKTLLLFDDQLKPKRNFQLDTAIYEIDIDWQNRVIYGIGKKPAPFVVTYKF